MRSAPGLAGVDTIGGYVKEYAVRPNAEQLAAYGLGLGDLVLALERSNIQAGAGFIQRAGEGLIVRADALALTVDDLAQAPITRRDDFGVIGEQRIHLEVNGTPRQDARCGGRAPPVRPT